ncbi:MAG: hypothetical protein IPJ86_07560 [Bacteroidetes bacterium]|nr:hypothetical protein [Bacteroidota bacterium]
MKYDIQDIQLFAALHGGKCLSKVYIDKYSPLSWMCKRGHNWDASYNTVYRGSWCKQCMKFEVQGHYLQEIKDIAISKKGVCLSDKYINKSTHLLFRCENGHEWLAKPNNIKSGWWCAHCSGNAKLNIDIFKKFAKTKGGKCLSNSYVNVKTKLLWQCNKGHQWKAPGNLVRICNTWCPFCAKNRKLSIKDMQSLAKSRGGKFLSKKYEPIAKMKWQCKYGHIWLTTSNKIMRGHWCHVCGNYQVKK